MAFVDELFLGVLDDLVARAKAPHRSNMDDYKTPRIGTPAAMLHTLPPVASIRALFSASRREAALACGT